MLAYECTPLVTMQRIPCVGHVLNLGVQVVLKKDSVVAVITRARKLVKKMRNVRALREELPKEHGLLKMQQQCLVLDIVTRWNSTYLMIDRLLQNLNAVSAVPVHNKILSDRLLSGEEIDVLRRLVLVLQPVHGLTEVLSGSFYVTSGDVVLAIVTLEELYNGYELDTGEP